MNIVKLDKPLEVDVIEWAYDHPNCDALVIRKTDYKSQKMQVVMYALNEAGNGELHEILKSTNNFDLFRGIDASMIDRI